MKIVANNDNREIYEFTHVFFLKLFYKAIPNRTFNARKMEKYESFVRSVGWSVGLLETCRNKMIFQKKIVFFLLKPVVFYSTRDYKNIFLKLRSCPLSVRVRFWTSDHHMPTQKEKLFAHLF